MASPLGGSILLPTRPGAWRGRRVQGARQEIGQSSECAESQRGPPEGYGAPAGSRGSPLGLLPVRPAVKLHHSETICICTEILMEDGVCCTSEESQQNPPRGS